ncbi:hypothetical protein [Streptomyces sp. ISL-100]|uniref:hypothetical protein n=1 Tax=Streptomyces sp. ISL-100 TaxID=2819173 RepID=UPI00203518EF|nr:hypothetical protein [Streptomyces sp. ISL-100]
MNERQRALLVRLANGGDPTTWTPGDWRSAYALRDRGLLRVGRRGREVHAEVTEAGRFYLRHGHHPDDPAFTDGGVQAVSAGTSAPATDSRRRGSTGRTRSPTPYSERPVARARRAKARELVERLVAERRVRLAEPDDDEVAEWRRVVDYAKRHGLEPQGKRIEKVRFGAHGVEMFLAEGPHPNSRSQKPKADASTVPVPKRLSPLHPAVAALRDDEERLVIPPMLRRRSLLILQALAAEAVRRGYEVREGRSHYSRREGGVDVVVDGFPYTVTIKQEFPQSTNLERAARLVVELDHGRTSRRGRWRDRKRGTLEDTLGVILGEIETRALEDAKHRVSEEQAKAEREIRWQAAMEKAKQLREEARRWREAAALGEYCDALERRLAELGSAPEESDPAAPRRWLEWARGYARAIDPLGQPREMPTPRDPTPEELKPYLHGWSPYGSERRAGR